MGQAQGYEIGASLFEEGKLDTARDLMLKARQRELELLLPIDVVVADRFEAEANTRVVASNQVEPGWRIMDIGPQTIAAFRQALADARTIVFNGTLGVAEWPAFAQGTNAIIEEVRAVLDRSPNDRVKARQNAVAEAESMLRAVT